MSNQVYCVYNHILMEIIRKYICRFLNLDLIKEYFQLSQASAPWCQLNKVNNIIYLVKGKYFNLILKINFRGIIHIPK